MKLGKETGDFTTCDNPEFQISFKAPLRVSITPFPTTSRWNYCPPVLHFLETKYSSNHKKSE